MNKQMPKQLTINGALYIRADQAQNQQNQNDQSVLTSALNTGQANNGLTIKIFADNGQNRSSRQNRRRQGNKRQSNRAQ